MDMAGLQRSEISFRRQGSSGLVWDDKFLAGALSQVKPNNDQEEEGEEEEQQKGNKGEEAAGAAASPITELKRSRSNRGGGGQAYKTVQVAPAADPPSPKVSGCGFCGAFGKPVNSHRRPKPSKRKS